MIAGMAVASCEFMFEETRSYVLQRKAFGKTIAHLQVCAVFVTAANNSGFGTFFIASIFSPQTVQHKLAELKTEICVARAFVDNCLQLHTEKRLDATSASMAKYW